MSVPTFEDKVDRITQAGNRINLVVADDINQLKNAIIALYGMFSSITLRSCVVLTKDSFAGHNYQNSRLINLVPDVDFRVFSNAGSGSLLRWNDDGYDDLGGYAFTPATGTLNMDPGDYSVEIYSSIPVQ